jgi:hypothetical protein
VLSAIAGMRTFAPSLFVLGVLPVDPAEYQDPIDFSFRDGLRGLWINTPFGNFLAVWSSTLNVPQQLFELGIGAYIAANYEVVYRLYDSTAGAVPGQSGPNGQSWTPENPAFMSYPRDRLGLGNFNDMYYIAFGLVKRSSITERKTASSVLWIDPQTGQSLLQRGGGIEYTIPNSASAIINRVDMPFWIFRCEALGDACV